MDNVIASQVLKLFGAIHHIRATEVVAHYFNTKVLSGFYNTSHGFFMRAGHNHHVCCPGFCHHLSFEVSAIHGFEVGDNRYIRKFFSQCANTMQPFGKNKRCASFQPVNTGAHGQCRGAQRFFQVGKIK